MSSDDEDGGDGRMIAWPLERLARLMRAREHRDGLNPAQWEALRYLGRANRFSNAPVALTRYLGATKGTISQTVKALERKGFISKAARSGNSKSIALCLTAKGLAALEHDPWAALADASSVLGGKTRRRMQRGLDDMLRAELAREGLPSFGVCASCRFFRENGGLAPGEGLHRCMVYDADLTVAEAGQICAAHTPKA